MSAKISSRVNIPKIINLTATIKTKVVTELRRKKSATYW